MNTPTRRAFLALAQNAVAAAAVGAIGVRLIETAEAMPATPNLEQARTLPGLATPVQWGPGPGWGPAPGWGPPRRRRRRWICWWHRGRRHCGWRWV
jgi:hypothetical protein